MIMNEKIKAAEVQLTGVNDEDLGIVSTKEALRMAKELRVDLVCLSLSTSPPPCKLVQQKDFKNQVVKQKQKERKAEKGSKVKEIRVSAFIEEHDYDTKKRQAERILAGGDAVQLTVRLEKKETELATQVAKRFVNDLTHCGKLDKGIQTSSKQILAFLYPL